MSVEFKLSSKLIPLQNNESIILEEYTDDGYCWVDVTYQYDEHNITIGSYSTYNYSFSREWMEYNDKYIAILSVPTVGTEVSSLIVNRIFDIQNKQFIEDTKEDRLSIYNNNFKKKLIRKR